ncbi:MAG TPA: hypothetical protein VG406_14955 [Isosphaeraceae bacterium]|jgi:TolA-binding protein|nr:hypothetical protein [Isosphaeraceae bacterium]
MTDDFDPLPPDEPGHPPALAPEPAPAPDPIFSAPPPPPPPPRRSPFPLVLGLLFLAAMAGAWVMHVQDVPAAASPAAAPATAESKPADEPKKDAAAPAPTPAAAEDTKALKDEVAALSRKVAELRDKVEAMPKPAPAPDLKPIESKLDELAKADAAVADLPKQVGALDEKVAALTKDLDSTKTDLAKVRDQAAKPAAAAAASPLVPDAEMAPAVELFKQKKYQDASTAFTKLAEAYPDDARAWYYATLAKGLATKDWDVNLVMKGVAREKAGTPDKAAIDSAFADLDKTTGKDWLAYYRAQAK